MYKEKIVNVVDDFIYFNQGGLNRDNNLENELNKVSSFGTNQSLAQTLTSHSSYPSSLHDKNIKTIKMDVQ